jgi:hypothetical protein
MEQSVEKYDPSRLMEMVRDRIRATYVSLIPEEQWTQLVKKEIESFFTEKETNEYSRVDYISSFRRVVYLELEKKAKEVVADFLKSISNNDWNGVGPTPGEFVKKFFAEKSSEILLGVMGSMIQSAINNASIR